MGPHGGAASRQGSHEGGTGRPPTWLGTWRRTRLPRGWPSGVRSRSHTPSASRTVCRSFWRRSAPRGRPAGPGGHGVRAVRLPAGGHHPRLDLLRPIYRETACYGHLAEGVLVEEADRVTTSAAPRLTAARRTAAAVDVVVAVSRLELDRPFTYLLPEGVGGAHRDPRLGPVPRPDGEGMGRRPGRRDPPPGPPGAPRALAGAAVPSRGPAPTGGVGERSHQPAGVGDRTGAPAAGGLGGGRCPRATFGEGRTRGAERSVEPVRRLRRGAKSCLSLPEEAAAVVRPLPGEEASVCVGGGGRCPAGEARCRRPRARGGAGSCNGQVGHGDVPTIRLYCSPGETGGSGSGRGWRRWGEGTGSWSPRAPGFAPAASPGTPLGAQGGASRSPGGPRPLLLGLRRGPGPSPPDRRRAWAMASAPRRHRRRWWTKAQRRWSALPERRSAARRLSSR